MNRIDVSFEQTLGIFSCHGLSFYEDFRFERTNKVANTRKIVNYERRVICQNERGSSIREAKSHVSICDCTRCCHYEALRMHR